MSRITGIHLVEVELSAKQINLNCNKQNFKIVSMRKSFKNVFFSFLILIGFSELSIAQAKPEFDLVLSGGRVIDPETKLDAIRNVGIRDHKIVAISVAPLKGRETIDVSGLVVAPGFIDLHVHGITNKEQEYQMHDGVTTALELEWGMGAIAKWYQSMQSKSLINYGASVCWPFERSQAIKAYQIDKNSRANGFHLISATADSINEFLKPTFYQSLNDEQIQQTLKNIQSALAEGGIGIGVPIGYLPGAKVEEVYRIYELAGKIKALIFTHVRDIGMASVQQVISDAMLTGAPLHIVHINSMSLSEIKIGIEMVQTAKQKGFDISTELYPYTASSTNLGSALFDEGWQKKMGITYGDLQWVATGERLSKETFEAYRKTGGIVIIHLMKPEWIRTGIASKGTMIASDGMPYAPLAHPRTAGTFTRVLGKYAREEKVIDLSTAIEKMTLLPARRLEIIAPIMRKKGRIQVGADADITIFNAATVTDKASFEKGLAFSEGIEYVIVNGSVILKNGKTVNHIFPGQPIYGKFKN